MEGLVVGREGENSGHVWYEQLILWARLYWYN